MRVDSTVCIQLWLLTTALASRVGDGGDGGDVLKRFAASWDVVGNPGPESWNFGGFSPRCLAHPRKASRVQIASPSVNGTQRVWR